MNFLLLIEGLSQLIKTIDINKIYNQNLTIDGIVLTMFDARNKLSSQVADDVKKHLPFTNAGNYHT